MKGDMIFINMDYFENNFTVQQQARWHDQNDNNHVIHNHAVNGINTFRKL